MAKLTPTQHIHGQDMRLDVIMCTLSLGKTPAVRTYPHTVLFINKNVMIEHMYNQKYNDCIKTHNT